MDLVDVSMVLIPSHLQVDESAVSRRIILE